MSGTRTGWRRYAIDTRPLRHPTYRRIFIGSATAFFGAQFTVIAVPIQMYAITRSDSWVGVLGVVGLIPLLVFALNTTRSFFPKTFAIADSSRE